MSTPTPRVEPLDIQPAPKRFSYRRRLFWVGLLYFSEGLPLGVFFDIFPVYFRQQGSSLADIGLLSLLGLAWTIKFLWAPVVDWARHHRWWISLANLGMAAVMLSFGSNVGTNQLSQLDSWTWVLIGAFTILSATSDIATDGYTIELLDRHEFGIANGFRIGFYRFGMLFAGAMLIVSGWYSWTAAYFLGGAIFTCNAFMALLAPLEPKRIKIIGSVALEFKFLRDQPLWILALLLLLGGLLWPAVVPFAKAMNWTVLAIYGDVWWFRGAIPVGLMFAGASLIVVAARLPHAQLMREGPIFGAWVELLSRPGMIGIITFILLFKLGDAAMGFMVKPFWVDAGFTNQQIGLVSVNMGLGLSIAGGLLGGWYVDTRGIYKGLWVLGLWQAVSNLGYALAAYVVPHAVNVNNNIDVSYQIIIYAASAIESLTGGLGTGAFLAFLMAITSRAKATTEYAILSSIFAFSRAVAGWIGGIGANEMGYAAYFFLTFWLSFPAYLLLPRVREMLRTTDSP